MENVRKIAIGSDHAGFELKEILKAHLDSLGIQVKDYGTHSPESVDYPDYAHQVASAIEAGDFEYGILICGTANGIAMAANKHVGIRAAIAWSESIARMARSHNDANVLCLPARVIAAPLAIDCLDMFLKTKFEGGRHERRVHKIAAC
jgi:ribose 5-phosphate isomerase B